MPVEAMAALRALHSQQSAERLAFGEGYRDTGLVAVGEDETPIRPETYSKTFAGHGKAAGCRSSGTTPDTPPPHECSTVG
jgi:hypothetical protein